MATLELKRGKLGKELLRITKTPDRGVSIQQLVWKDDDWYCRRSVVIYVKEIAAVAAFFAQVVK